MLYVWLAIAVDELRFGLFALLREEGDVPWMATAQRSMYKGGSRIWRCLSDQYFGIDCEN